MLAIGIRSACLCLLAGSFALGVDAQPQRRPQAAEAFRVQHFTTADGLPSKNVLAIEQDALGFLWLGTSNGLVRYDGYTFTPFANLLGGVISAVHEDATGHLWFGGALWDPVGLRRFDPRSERFTRFRHDPDDPNSLINDGVQAIISSPDEPGVLWIGSVDAATRGGGLSRLDAKTGTFTNYTTEDGLASNIVSALLIGREGTLWAGTRRGLTRLDPVTDTFTSFLLDPPPFYLSVIYEDRSGVLWIGTRGDAQNGYRGAGLHRFDRATEAFTSFLPQPADPSDPRNEVNVLLEDRTGRLWVGTNGGLFTFDRESERFILFPHQPADQSFQSIYEDRFGVLWIGCGEGLMKLERRLNPFTAYQRDPDHPISLAEDVLGPIYGDREDILWSSLGKQLPPGLPGAGNVVTSTLKDRAGTLWLGTCGPGPGLLRIDRGRDGQASRPSFRPFTAWDPADWQVSPCVNYMLEDRAGLFWMAAWGDGLLLLDRETGMLTPYRNNPDESDPSFSLHKPDLLFHLLEAPSDPGVLWVSTAAGPSRFDVQTKTFTNHHTEPLRRTMMTHEDRAGRFWVVSAQGGLHLFDRATGTIRETFTTADGLAHNAVWSILEDDRGFLWLSTSNGLSRFDPEARAFQNYDAHDGLPDVVFREGARFKSATGELFFGTMNFWVSFFPEDFTDNPFPPEVVLKRLEIAGEAAKIGPDRPLKASMMMTEAVTLSHTQNDLVFAYVGLHFIEPAENRYRYVLEGYDSDWVNAGIQRAARYPKLPPGDYVFRVQAASSDGVWNEEGASVRLTILPPWWRTTWAYALYGLLFAAGVFAVNRFHRRRLIRLERERARIRTAEKRAEVLQELDYLKSRFFVNVSHEFRTPLTLILGPLHDLLDGAYGDLDPQQRAHLSIMQRNGARLLHLLNQLLDLSRLEAGSMTLHARRANVVPVLRRTVVAFASRAECKHITLQFHAADDEIDLYFEADKLEKILTNLLSNAFKFTPEHGKVRVNVEAGLGEAGAYVEIVVKDTGPGIPADHVPFIFDRFHQVDASTTREQEGTGIGLALVKELVSLHGGTVRVESEVDFGTAFFVRLPQGRAHLTDAEVMDETPGEVQGDGMEALAVSQLAMDAVVKAEGDAVSSGTPADGAPVVLIVEDNADMLAYLGNHLGAIYRIEEAADGAAGLERARAVMPALVISDVMMPRMDGFALCCAIKTDPRLNHIPVILLTAKVAQESKLEGLKLCADAYLSKPFSMEELQVRVENLIEIRRTLRRRFSGEVVITPSEVVVSSEEAAFLEQVREIVERNMADHSFGVEALAEEVGLSRRQLQRRLQPVTDLSPAGYIRMMRLERAAQLLERHAGRVSEVAYAVGFGSAAHFSRVFRQVFGVPPSAYPENAEREATVADADKMESVVRESPSR